MRRLAAAGCGSSVALGWPESCVFGFEHCVEKADLQREGSSKPPEECEPICLVKTLPFEAWRDSRAFRTAKFLAM